MRFEITETAPRAAMADWVRHHASCQVCREQDWYQPGPPVISTEPRDGWRPVATRRGVVYYRPRADAELLCRLGRALFLRWEKLVTRPA